MTGDMQGIFGAISATHDDAAQAGTAQRKLRVRPLNVNSAGPDRAQQLLEWMLSTKCNVLVLSEMKPSAPWDDRPADMFGRGHQGI